MTRKNPTMAEKLASALLELQRLRGDPFDREHAKAMTAEQICSLFQFDHAAGFVAHGADNHPTGLTPLLIGAHRAKTARIDKPAIAKCTRLEKSHADFRARLMGRTTPETKAKLHKAKMRSAGFQKGHRPLKSSFAEGK